MIHSMITRREREMFEQHASPEAIRARLDQIRARVVEAQNELGWLECLYIKRVAEKSTGQWPRQSETQR